MQLIEHATASQVSDKSGRPLSYADGSEGVAAGQKVVLTMDPGADLKYVKVRSSRRFQGAVAFLCPF